MCHLNSISTPEGVCLDYTRARNTQRCLDLFQAALSPWSIMRRSMI